MHDYILIGRKELSSTQRAIELLDDAKIDYSFEQADITEGPLPQLVDGLTAFIGLGQISRTAYWHKKNTLQPKLILPPPKQNVFLALKNEASINSL